MIEGVVHIVQTHSLRLNTSFLYNQPDRCQRQLVLFFLFFSQCKAEHTSRCTLQVLTLFLKLRATGFEAHRNTSFVANDVSWRISLVYETQSCQCSSVVSVATRVQTLIDCCCFASAASLHHGVTIALACAIPYFSRPERACRSSNSKNVPYSSTVIVVLRKRRFLPYRWLRLSSANKLLERMSQSFALRCPLFAQAWTPR